MLKVKYNIAIFLIRILIVIVFHGPVMDWQLVQGVSCLPPNKQPQRISSLEDIGLVDIVVIHLSGLVRRW